MMSDRENILELIELLSELNVLYVRTKTELEVALPNVDVNSLCKRFHGTELGDTLRPLTNADIVLGETLGICSLYMMNALDDKSFMAEFNRLSKARLSCTTLDEYTKSVKVYISAYKSSISDLKPIVGILSAKFINPEIVPF